MSDPNEKPSPDSASDLDRLGARLRELRGEETPDTPQGQSEDASMLGLAWRLSTEMVAALVVGLGLGWGVDTLSGGATKPFGILLGALLGMVTGLRNAVLTANRMDAEMNSPSDPSDS